jgi:hypothetical protein
MGLDMMLYGRKKDGVFPPIFNEGSWFGEDDFSCYWRKANQIHAWFVDNVQGGVDECELTEVSAEQLEKLLNLCILALETQNPELLPPRGGFFFGSTKIDDSYWRDIEQTVTYLRDALKLRASNRFFYLSSW